MSSYNSVTLVGNLARDPESRTTSSGGKIVHLSVATSERWKDRASGERKERSEFHRCVIFNERLAEVAERYLRKGSKVLVRGALQTRKWTDQSGQERYSTEVVLQQYRGEIVMLDGRGDGSDNAPSAGAPRQQAAAPSAPAYDPEDDVPW